MYNVCYFAAVSRLCTWCVHVSGDEEELGSSEESGKDWDELEEEARRGEPQYAVTP